ncbi:hypothetical protein Emag_004220 [Eimeria magna]
MGLHALPLKAEKKRSVSRQAEGCDTPFHQEIHLGLSPPRNGSSSSSSSSSISCCLAPPRFAADRRVALSRYPDTPAAAEWEKDASPLWNNNTAPSSSYNSPSPRRQQEAATTVKATAAAAAAAAAAGASCSGGLPVAAVPAYSLV